MEDNRGVPVSAGNSKSLEIYERALAALNIYRGDPAEIIDEALAEDPDFVMGHILRAHVHITLWERSIVGEVDASLERLDALANAANERERAHVAALKKWVAGDWNGYRGDLERLQADYPRDLLALQVGHIADFMHGDRENLRGRVLRALGGWSPSTPGYSYLIGMKSFGLEECGDYSAAEEAGRHALDLDAEDCWAQHAVAHVMEMQGRQAEGIVFMEANSANWAQSDNGFQFHNWWHTGLFYMDQGLTDRALEIYDSGVRAEPEGIQLMMLDAAAMLWRLHLNGTDVGNRWDELATLYQDDGEGGFYAFNDMHAMAALTATGRTEAAATRLKAIEEAATDNGRTGSMMAREVGLPIARGIEAFGRQAYGEAVEHLMPVRNRAFLFGGSHAQRDIIHRTLIEAALRAGDRALSLALSGERTSLKPHCPFTWKLASRANAIES